MGVRHAECWGTSRMALSRALLPHLHQIRLTKPRAFGMLDLVYLDSVAKGGQKTEEEESCHQTEE